MSHRAALLASWRDFVELLRRLPPDLAAARKADAASQIRAGAAAAAGATGTPPDASADGLKRLMAAVATLRATTARVPGERRGGRGGVYVLREGRLVREDGGGDRGASTSRCVSFFSFFSSPSSQPASARACAATLSPLISLFPHLSPCSSIGAGRLSAGEAVDRHRSLMKRQYFGRDPPPGRRLF